VWNRTVKTRNPETGRKVSKARPKEECERIPVPKLRIVSEELWNAVRAQIVHVNRNRVGARLGGMNRTSESRSYLFSGLLVCNSCKSRLVIISGRGKRGYVRYGCPSHRYRGVTIRQDRLEEQLLAAIEQRLSNPRMIEYVLVRFQEELQKRLAELQRQNVGLEDLRRERVLLKATAQRLVEAVAATGHSPALLSNLAANEGQIADLDRRIEAFKPMNVVTSLTEIRDFVNRNVMNLRGLLHEDASRVSCGFKELRVVSLDAIWTPAPSLKRLDSTRTPHFETVTRLRHSQSANLRKAFAKILKNRMQTETTIPHELRPSFCPFWSSTDTCLYTGFYAFTKRFRPWIVHEWHSTLWRVSHF